jgi:heme/copper-type cytochrome/quinol oxidase subunit 4
MTFLLISGIVLTVVPIILMIGFAAFIFFMFMKDDPDSSSLVKIAFVVMLLGIALIAAHYLLQTIN